MKRLQIHLVLLAALATFLTSCMDADPLGLTTRRIVNDYKLHQFEDGNYYLLKDGHDDQGGGYIAGIVLQIGWNKQTLAAKRKANFGGDPDGWMIIDLISDQMTGPITDEQFKRLKLQSPALIIYDSKTAWKQLGK